jgi:hypothetical protein
MEPNLKYYIDICILDEIDMIVELSIKNYMKNTILESNLNEEKKLKIINNLDNLNIEENDKNVFFDNIVLPTLILGNYLNENENIKIVPLQFYEIMKILNDNTKYKKDAINLVMNEYNINEKQKYNILSKAKNFLEKNKFENIRPDLKELIEFIVNYNEYAEENNYPMMLEILENKNDQSIKIINEFVKQYNHNKRKNNNIFETTLLCISYITFKENLKNKKNINESINSAINLIDTFLKNKENRIRLIWEEKKDRATCI